MHTHTYTHMHTHLSQSVFTPAGVGFPGGISGKKTHLPMQETKTPVQFLGREDPLEEGMATHPSILA